LGFFFGQLLSLFRNSRFVEKFPATSRFFPVEIKFPANSRFSWFSRSLDTLSCSNLPDYDVLTGPGRGCVVTLASIQSGRQPTWHFPVPQGQEGPEGHAFHWSRTQPKRCHDCTTMPQGNGLPRSLYTFEISLAALCWHSKGLLWRILTSCVNPFDSILYLDPTSLLLGQTL